MSNVQEIVPKKIDTQLKKDGFGLLATASPTTLFDAQFTYDLQPLLYEQVSPTGGTITHDTTNKCANISVNTASAIDCFMQSYGYFRYQPGKAQRIYLTFNFKGASANATKFAQYGDGNNAFRVELREDGTAWAGIITTTTEGNNLVEITNAVVDWNKEQILIIEFEALYVGSITYSLQLENNITLVAEINNSNNSDYPYIATANLPIRVGVETDGTGTANTDMLFNCVSVQSSGGVDETVGYQFSTPDTVIVAGNGTRTHLVSIRPRLLFNTFENRVKLALIELNLIVTGNSPIYWEVLLGGTFSVAPTWANVNTNYSAIEYGVGGTISGAAIVINSGYISSSAQNKGNLSKTITERFPITLDAAGLQRANGSVTIALKGIGSSSAARGVVNYKEIR